MELSKEKEKAPARPVDIIQPMIGSFGKYHLYLCFIVFMSKFPIAWHQIAIVFLAPKVSYKCNNVANSCPCSNPQYDRTVFTNSIIMKWHLICDKKWLANFSQTIFQLGTLIGSVLFGMASDRFGRKKPMIAAVIMQVAAGVSAAFVPEFWMFSVLRFIIGVSVGGTMVVGFVIIMEYVGTQYRDTISALYQIPFTLGHLSLPLFGYLLRDYSHFQLWISLPVAILLAYIFILPESFRWLLATKNTEKAIRILEKVARINNRKVDGIRAEVEASQAQQSSNLKKGNILDLFRTPNIRKNILVMAYDWLTCSYCFYGVSQYVGQLSGNIFVNVAIGACFTTFGTFAAIPVMKILGRRTILISCNFICGVCLIALAFIPVGPIGSVILASIGEVASFVAFVLVYLYCSELFPTVVRNAAIGFSSMMARVGSMLAPFVIGLQSTATWLPPVAFGILPLIAAVLTFLLPETKGCELMTTIEEGEAFGKKRDKSNAAQEETSNLKV